MADRHIVLDYTPRPQFKPYHRRKERFACLVCHRRAGKTVATVRDLERSALRATRINPPPHYAFIAPLFRQVKELAWVYVKRGARQVPGAIINEADCFVQYPNGARLRLYGGDNPESLRGMYLDGVVLDEYADIKPDLFNEILSPQLIDYQGFATFIGTPKGRDAFYEKWVEAVSSPNWFSLMLKASDTGLIPQAELDRERGTMSVSKYNREFECSFDEPDIQQFISGLEAIAAQERKSIPSGPRLMGVDVARMGEDRTVIVYRDGDVLEEISTFRKIDNMQVVGEVAKGIALYKPDMVFIDGIGTGSGVVDRLKQLGFQVIDVNSGRSATDPNRFKNLRAEMWFKMRDWLRDRAQIPKRHDLTNDLCSVLYKYDHRNALQIESKDDIRKRNLSSPDIADALALTFSQPIAVKEVIEERRRMYATPQEYDPLAGWRHDGGRPALYPSQGYDPLAGWRSGR